VPGDGVQLRAGRADVLECDGVQGPQIVGVDHDPSSDGAGTWDRPWWWRGDRIVLEQPHIVVDGGRAAAVALVADFPEQLGCVAAPADGDALVQVGL
jgi:hypothetical protein